MEETLRNRRYKRASHRFQKSFISIKLGSSSMPQTAAETLSWTFPAAPFSINLQISAMKKLQVAIAQEETVEEIGGVLLGSADISSAKVDITDFIRIRSVAAPGGRYTLDTTEVERLRNQQVDSESEPQISVIGYFRTQVQSALDLRETELDLVKRHFADPTNVVLLIQTERKTAGFFCWCGDFFTPVSFKDFAFDALSPVPDVGRQHPIEGPVRPPAPSLAPSQSYFNRAVLATGLAILTVALMFRPTASVITSRPHQSTVQPSLPNRTPFQPELREKSVYYAGQVDGEAPLAPPSTAATRPSEHPPSAQHQLAGIAKMNPDRQKNSNSLSQPGVKGPDASRTLTSLTKFTPLSTETRTDQVKVGYVWR